MRRVKVVTWFTMEEKRENIRLLAILAFKNEFTVLNANFQSLWHKRVELCNLALETKSDIIVGTETWLTGDVKNSELLLDDYDVYRRDRASRGGGGPHSC